jgi:hypothetical protein
MKDSIKKATAEKWYDLLDFPKEAYKEFKSALEAWNPQGATSIDLYNTSEKDGKKNLLSYLFFCDELEKGYQSKGIPNNVLIDTLKDIVIWTKTWSALKNELYLGEVEWLKRHLSMKLFRLGRLQFCMADSEFDIPEKNVKKGDPTIEIHIPEGEPLLVEECIRSIELARDFFKRYFPNYNYTLFTCHSWLLDTSLDRFLKPDSNILKFGGLFKVVKRDSSDALLGYIFRWGIKREELESSPAVTSLAKKIKSAALNGEEFYECLGYIEK